VKKTVMALATVLLAAASAGGQDTARQKGWVAANFRKPPAAELQKKLTPLQFEVTQRGGTERPFANEYADNHRPGIYVDVVSGEPLFSSLDKYDSGTGWPSFTKPLEKANVKTGTDYKMIIPRSEVRSVHADSPALLHELRRDALHPRREARRGGIRPVRRPLQEFETEEIASARAPTVRVSLSGGTPAAAGCRAVRRPRRPRRSTTGSRRGEAGSS
jgi:methionine-R-sulfoxide reductase